MSTILKALRRLERERQPDPSRPLHEDVVAYRPGEPQESPRRPVSLAAGAAVVIALGLGGLWLSSEGGGSGSEPWLAAEPRASAGAESRERSARTTTAPRPAPPVAVTEPARRLEPAPKPQPVAPDLPSPAAWVEEASDAAPATDDELPYRLPDPTPLAAFEVPAPREEVAEVSTVPARPARTRLAEPEPPSPAPTAKVESTTWHPDPGRRVARVSAPGRDAVSLREGDALGELVILRIEPAGVVFLYRGHELRQGVGE